MTLRQLILAVKQPLLHIALHLSVVMDRMPQLRERLGELCFDFALKDFSLRARRRVRQCAAREKAE
jgi:hypothetical protein